MILRVKYHNSLCMILLLPCICIIIVDTKNNTYLTPYALSIFRSKPYIDLDIIVNEHAVIEPTTSYHRKLFKTLTEINEVDEENCKSTILSSKTCY